MSDTTVQIALVIIFIISFMGIWVSIKTAFQDGISFLVFISCLLVVCYIGYGFYTQCDGASIYVFCPKD